MWGFPTERAVHGNLQRQKPSIRYTLRELIPRDLHLRSVDYMTWQGCLIQSLDGTGNQCEGLLFRILYWYDTYP